MREVKKKKEMNAQETPSDKSKNLISHIAEEIEKNEKMRIKKMIML